jgi:hypothetical protein
MILGSVPSPNRTSMQILVQRALLANLGLYLVQFQSLHFYVAMDFGTHVKIPIAML